MPEETIGRTSIKLGADGSKLGPEMAAAVAKAQGTLERSNKKIERAQAQTTRAIQGQINKINAKRPAQEMRNLEQAVRKMGGASKLEAGQVKRLRMEVERLAKAGANVPKSLAGIGKTRGGVGEGLSAASAVGQGLLPISAGVGALGFGVVKLASDFESSFAGVRKTVDATEAEFAALSDGFRQMSEEIPVSVNELNSIGEAAGQLGIETKNILGFTRVMADLGATTNLSAQEAATALARLANITGLPQDQFDELGSTIVDLGNKFETTESEIVDFGLRIAGAGRLAGLSEAEILAIGTAMSSIGVKAEAGGTAVQKVLNQMTAAVATNNEELAIFAETAGLSAQAFADAFKADAAGAFAAFVEGLGKQGTQAFSTMEDLKLESERVIRAFLGLAGAGDLLSNALGTGNAAWKENTALTKEAAERYATFGSQLTIFWNQVKNVGTTLGTALLPILISVMDVMKKGLPVVKGAAKSFASLPKPVQAAALALGALVTAAGPVLIALGFMAPGVAALIPLFGAATPVVAGLAAAFLPLTAVIAGLVGGANLGLWLRENSELFRQFTDFVGDAITKLTGLDLYFKTLEKGRDVTAEWTEEQKASLAELKKRQKALAEFVGPLQKVTKETKQQTEETKRQTQSVKKLTAEQKRAAAEFQRLLDSLSGAAAQAEIEKLAKAVNVLGVEGVADIEALRKKLEQLQKQGAEITDEGLLGILRGGKIEIPEESRRGQRRHSGHLGFARGDGHRGRRAIPRDRRGRGEGGALGGGHRPRPRRSRGVRRPSAPRDGRHRGGDGRLAGQSPEHLEHRPRPPWAAPGGRADHLQHRHRHLGDRRHPEPIRQGAIGRPERAVRFLLKGLRGHPGRHLGDRRHCDLGDRDRQLARWEARRRLPGPGGRGQRSPRCVLRGARRIRGGPEVSRGAHRSGSRQEDLRREDR
jgi:TP901 family phage tail tape measure protein